MTENCTMHRYQDYRWLRGFNIVPAWGATIEQAYLEYDPARFRQELATAVKFHANTIRLWIDFCVWMIDPKRIEAVFADAVSAIDEAGMKVMPCLSNRWHDLRYDYGGTYFENLTGDFAPRVDYLRALVSPFANDERILLWDLCNEPGATDPASELAALELRWLGRTADVLRQINVRQPVTVGTYMAGQNIEIFAHLCDVLCCHPYGRTPEELASMLERAVTISRVYGKPMLVNEAIPGALDDFRRADCARWSIAMMEDFGFGWMGWALTEGRAISTRRDRYDGNGLNNEGFHVFVNADGSPRRGLAFLTEPPRFIPPWQR